MRILHVLAPKLWKVIVQAAYLPRTFALVWRAAHAWTTAWLCLLLVQGILPVAVVYLTRPLVDAIVTAANSHGDPARVRYALLLAAAMACVLLLIEVLRSVSD